MVETCLITCMMDLDCVLCAGQCCPSASMLVRLWYDLSFVYYVIEGVDVCDMLLFDQ